MTRLKVRGMGEAGVSGWRRWWPYAVVLLLVAVYLLPILRTLTYDDEGFYSEILSTVLQARALQDGVYVFWTNLLGFGSPLPFSQNLVFQPLMPLFGLLPLRWAVFWFYLALLSAGGAGFVALCRRLEIPDIVAPVAVVTFLCASPSINSVFTDFWPTVAVVWCLFPLGLWALLSLLDAESTFRRLLYTLVAALVFSLAFLNGHMGIFSVYAVGLAIFLAAAWRQSLPRLPWLLFAAVLIIVVSASHLYDLASELSRFGAESTGSRTSNQSDYFNLYLFLAGPVANFIGFSYAPEGVKARTIIYGLPFAVLALTACFHRGITNRHRFALAVTMLVCIPLIFVPSGKITLGPINWWMVFRGPAMLAATLLAGLRLGHLLLREGSRGRRLAYGLLILQVIWCVGTFFPYWNWTMTQDHRFDCPTLRSTLQAGPLVQKLKTLYSRRPGRIMLSHDLFENMAKYRRGGITQNIMAYHGLPQVNAYLKGVHYGVFYPTEDLMHGETRFAPANQRNNDFLDVLGIRYLVALAGEPVAPGLVPEAKINLKPGADAVIYQNPDAWPLAFVARSSSNLEARLPRLPAVGHDRLLAADFGPVRAMKSPTPVEVRYNRWGKLVLRLPPGSQERTVALTMYYRPQWRAWGRKDGGTWRPLEVKPVLEGFTAVMVPGADQWVMMRFEPTTRMILTALSWVGLFLLAAVSAVLAWLTRKSKRGLGAPDDGCREGGGSTIARRPKNEPAG